MPSSTVFSYDQATWTSFAIVHLFINCEHVFWIFYELLRKSQHITFQGGCECAKQSHCLFIHLIYNFQKLFNYKDCQEMRSFCFDLN